MKNFSVEIFLRIVSTHRNHSTSPLWTRYPPPPAPTPTHTQFLRDRYAEGVAQQMIEAIIKIKTLKFVRERK